MEVRVGKMRTFIGSLSLREHTLLAFSPARRLFDYIIIPTGLRVAGTEIQC